MAEGHWRALAGSDWECFSAGSRPAGYVHPLAIRVMQEIGIDISALSSKHVVEFQNQSFDLVVTVCDSAKEACPVLPTAAETLHWPFEDPVSAPGSENDQLVAFRRVRDQIHRRIKDYLRQSE